MKQKTDILKKSVALVALLAILLSLPGPGVIAQPQRASAGVFGEGGPVNTLMEAIMSVIQRMVVTKLRQMIQSWLAQINIDCPDWLKLSGQDICREIIGDWTQFLSDVVDRNLGELAGDINLMNAPPDLKTALLQSITFVPSYQTRTQYTLGQYVNPASYFSDPLRNGNWITWIQSFSPQNSYLGQLLAAHDELQRRIAADKEAEERLTAGQQTPEYSSYIDQDCLAQGNTPSECRRYKTEVTAAAKEKSTLEIMVAGQKLTINLENLAQAIIAIVVSYLEQALNQTFFGSLPQ